MPTSKQQSFTPPSPKQVTEHLVRCAPRVSRMWVTQLPLFLLIFAAGLTLFANDVLTAIIPWLILIGVVIFSAFRVKRIRNIQQRVERVGEWTQLGQHQRAVRAIWKLLMITQMMPELHGRLVALMAHNLDRLSSWPAAEVAYDYLITRMPADHPGSVQLQLQRTILQLFNDELTTADNNIRKLRPLATEISDSPIAATYHYAVLLQHIRTYHFAEAVAENREHLVERLRPLGIEAGHGYALLAWSYFQLAQRQPDDENLMQQAMAWWHKATLLVASDQLLQRQADLKPLAAHAAYQSGVQVDEPFERPDENEQVMDLDEPPEVTPEVIPEAQQSGDQIMPPEIGPRNDDKDKETDA